jgi:hypothetical protein
MVEVEQCYVADKGHCTPLEESTERYRAEALDSGFVFWLCRNHVRSLDAYLRHQPGHLHFRRHYVLDLGFGVLIYTDGRHHLPRGLSWKWGTEGNGEQDLVDIVVFMAVLLLILFLATNVAAWYWQTFGPVNPAGVS